MGSSPMTPPTPPRRRWFRYSLRTFFVVLTIFGVWLGVQVKWIRDRHAAIELHHCGAYRTGHEPVETHFITPKDAPLSIRVLGEPGIAEIIMVIPQQDEDSVEAKHNE